MGRFNTSTYIHKYTCVYVCMHTCNCVYVCSYNVIMYPCKAYEDVYMNKHDY